MEYFDVCGEDGLPTGQIVSRERAHREGIPHRTAHIWVIRENAGRTEVLLQKRSMEKESFPGRFDTSSAGHIQAGDEPLESAQRELFEELGIAAQPQQLAFAGIFRILYEKEFSGRLFRDNEYCSVYVYSQPVEIASLHLQESEVEEVRWFDLEDSYERIRTDRGCFCVPMEGLDMLIAFLKKRGEKAL